MSVDLRDMSLLFRPTKAGVGYVWAAIILYIVIFVRWAGDLFPQAIEGFSNPLLAVLVMPVYIMGLILGGTFVIGLTHVILSLSTTSERWITGSLLAIFVIYTLLIGRHFIYANYLFWFRSSYEPGHQIAVWWLAIGPITEGYLWSLSCLSYDRLERENKSD